MAVNLNNPQAFQQFKQPGQGGGQGAPNQPQGQQQQQGQSLGQQQQPVQQSRKQAGTGYVNTGQVVQSNVGSGQKMGQQIAQNYASQVGSSLGQIGQGMTQAQQQAQAEQNRLAQGQQFNQQVQQDPNQIASNQQQLQQFQQLYNPQGFSQQQQAQAQAMMAQGQQATQQQQQQLRNLTTPEGRLAALQQMYQGPNYTQGQQKLDQLVLGQAGLNPIQQQRQQLNQQLAGARGQQELQGKQLLAQLQANMQQERDVSDLLRGTTSGETNKIVTAQQQAAQAKTLENQNLQDIYSRYLQGDQNLTPEQQQLAQSNLESQGLNSGLRTYNVLQGGHWQDYLNAGGNVTAQDVINQQDFGRYDALNQLAGTPETDRMFTQAGTGGKTTNVDTQRLLGDVSKANEAFQTLAGQEQRVTTQGQLDDYGNVTNRDISTVGHLLEQPNLGQAITGYEDISKYNQPNPYLNILKNNPNISAVNDTVGGHNAQDILTSGTINDYLTNQNYTPTTNANIITDTSQYANYLQNMAARGMPVGSNLGGMTPEQQAANSYQLQANRQFVQQQQGNWQNMIKNLLNQEGYYNILGGTPQGIT